MCCPLLRHQLPVRWFVLIGKMQRTNFIVRCIFCSSRCAGDLFWGHSYIPELDIVNHKSLKKKFIYRVINYPLSTQFESHQPNYLPHHPKLSICNVEFGCDWIPILLLFQKNLIGKFWINCSVCRNHNNLIWSPSSSIHLSGFKLSVSYELK